jgi:hypothetical protein
VIEGIVGYPGQGKTYYALDRAKREMSKKTKHYPNGRPVYCNFAIEGTKPITPETMFDIESGALVIIDEAQNWFGSRNWQQFGNRYMEFFSQTRKKQYTLLWISQDVSSVDKMIRDRTHLIHETRSIGSGIFGRPLYFRVTTYYGAKNLGKSQHWASNKWVWFKKAVAESYDTTEIIHTRLADKADTRGNF